MHTAKQDALEIIQKLPNDADMEEIMYRLYVLDKIRRGQSDIEQGKTVEVVELQQEMEAW